MIELRFFKTKRQKKISIFLKIFRKRTVYILNARTAIQIKIFLRRPPNLSTLYIYQALIVVVVVVARAGSHPFSSSSPSNFKILATLFQRSLAVRKVRFSGQLNKCFVNKCGFRLFFLTERNKLIIIKNRNFHFPTYFFAQQDLKLIVVWRKKLYVIILQENIFPQQKAISAYRIIIKKIRMLKGL